MSELTKEWLQQTIAELEEERDAVPGIVNEDAAKALAAMKLALASLETDVVAWTDEQELRDVDKYGCGYLFTANPITPNADPRRVIKLYTAPPAPVSVPDVVSWEDVPEEITEDDIALASAWAHGFNQCRAAMLQGAEPVSNRDELPDGWVACSERMPEGMTDVHISNGHDVGQGWWDGDTWQTQHDYYSVPGDVTHWMPLPAAPQQEVK
ncbi:DUF551 domain-containing protein [Enterobacter hormaechei subsp. xiangfangensis]|uniref:DUF551 domain-containing protein n=1 Tax=Enterobacter hormaechei TaxID=158836 RepID=UPI0013FDD051|nr:DUF551 domain-containing protein [Enterobacter hormaechei]